jgi:hypothetical protein
MGERCALVDLWGKFSARQVTNCLLQAFPFEILLRQLPSLQKYRFITPSPLLNLEPPSPRKERVARADGRCGVRLLNYHRTSSTAIESYLPFPDYATRPTTVIRD